MLQKDKLTLKTIKTAWMHAKVNMKLLWNAKILQNPELTFKSDRHDISAIKVNNSIK